MIRREMLLTVAILAFWACNLQAGQTPCSWVGGEEGLWEDANNWSCGIVPDNNESQTFAITINTGTSNVAATLSENHCIDQLGCYGDVELRSGVWNTRFATLTVGPNGLTNYGDLEIENLYIDGNIINTDGATVIFDEEHGHEDRFRGYLYNHAGGFIDIQDSLNFDEVGHLDNAGTITIEWGAKIYGGTFTTITNTGTLNLRNALCVSFVEFLNDSNGIIAGSGAVQAEERFENRGTICANTGAIAVVCGGSFINTGILRSNGVTALDIQALAADVNNQGTIEINAGGSVTSISNLTNKPDAVIKMLGGTLIAPTITQSASATFEGFGNITGDVNIDANGLVKLIGSTNIVGNVNVGSGAVLEVRDGITLITGHTTNNGTIRMIGGRVICQGGLTNNGEVIWEPGTYTNQADFNLDGSVDMRDFAEFADTWLWHSALK